MKQTALLLTLLFCFLQTCCQQSNDLTKYQDTVFIRHDKDWTSDVLNYIIDTVIFESGMRRHILAGTTILPATHNSNTALEYGLYFSKVEKSRCRGNSEDFGAKGDHINSIVSTDTTLIIDFNLVDNCCYDFLCDISVDSNKVLNLIYSGYGTYCSCYCCFGLTYYLQKSQNNFDPVPQIKSVMVNGNRKTLMSIKK